MKKIFQLLTVLAIAAVSLSVTSCRDDWYGHRYRYWEYRHPGHTWNNVYNEVVIIEDNTSDAAELANALLGEWGGTVIYQYTDDNNQTAQTEFGAIFTFNRYSGGGTSLNGTGTEHDFDGQGNEQTLQFDWYVDQETSDIYIRYRETGKTFMMDIDAKVYGFLLDTGAGTFQGYAIGTNTTDMLYFDLKRQYNQKAKAEMGKAAAQQKTFGTSRSAKLPVDGPVQKKLMKR